MNGTDRDTIRSWLEEQLIPTEGLAPIKLIAILHHRHDGSAAEVHAITDRVPAWGKPEQLAELVDNISARHCRGVVGGGAQQLELSVVRDGNGKSAASLPFIKCGPATIMANGSLATEPPNAVGAQAQSMRLLEVLSQGFFSGIANNQQVLLGALDKTANLLDKVTHRLDAVEKNSIELWTALKACLVELRAQEFDMRMKALSAARINEFVKQGLALAPAAMNALAGRELVPMQLAERSIIQTAAAKLRPEDQAVIVKAISNMPNGEMVGAMLANEFAAARKKQAAEAEAESHLLRDNGIPTDIRGERDAMGLAVRVLRGDDDPNAPKPLPPGSGEAILDATAKVIDAANGASVDDTKLWDEVMSEVGSNKGMLVSILSAKNPDLAARFMARFPDNGGR
jgi:hypothetical protein